MRRLVILALCGAVAGCAGPLLSGRDTLNSPLLPRDAFGVGAPALLEDSPVRYLGAGRGPAPIVERLTTAGGDAWYVAYPLAGPNASIVRFGV